MSHDPTDPEIDARLDRHIDALRDDANRVSGPSPEALARTLAMLAADPLASGGADLSVRVPAPPESVRAGDRSTWARLPVPLTSATDDAAARPTRAPANLNGWFEMNRFRRFVAVAASLAVIAGLIAFGATIVAPTVAYADVVEKIVAARGLAYMTTVDVPGAAAANSMRIVRGEGGKMRIEMAGGRVVVSDGARHLALDPAKKLATRIEVVGGPTSAPAAGAPSAVDLVAALKSAAGGKTEPLGERTLDGVTCVGFRAPWNGTGSMEVWADRATAQPVRIALTMQMAGRTVTSMMDQFEFDPPVDATTFSTNVPAGYALETQKIDVTLATQGKVAEAVVAVLKAYAAASDGALPKDLNDWADMMRMDAKGKPRLDPQTIGAMSGQLFSLPGGYSYAGKGVKVGDAKALVFWYRPAKSETYRAVFGDLRIEDVDASRLPTTPPAK